MGALRNGSITGFENLALMTGDGQTHGFPGEWAGVTI